MSAPGKPLAPPAPPPIGGVWNGFKRIGEDTKNPASWQQLEGDDYLKTLGPDDQAMVRMMAEGKQPWPGGYAITKPYWQNKITQASRYDPTFDAVNWPTRVATRVDMAKGKMGQNITSFNTAIQHIARLSQSADALNNTSLPAWNNFSNWVNTETGDPRATRFNIDKNAVVDELTRAFRGTGGNVYDIKNWEKAVDSSQSPAQLHAAVNEALGLLKGRIDAIGDQYSRGMGKASDPLHLLNPEAQKAFSYLNSKYGEGQSVQSPHPKDIDALLKKYGH